MSDAAYEITVIGDAPEGEPEGSTDVIEISRDMVEFYVPLGPTIIMPPIDPPVGGGGGDQGTAKENWKDVESKSIIIAAEFAVAGIIAGAVFEFGAVVFGLIAWQAGEAADDPPQPNYKRVAGSTVPTRKLALTGTASQNRYIETLVAAERAFAVFIDAIECAQGAFLAADTVWTQRHNLAARTAYVACGKALLNMATTHDQLAGLLKPTSQTPAQVQGLLPKLLADTRKALGLSATDEAHITDQISSALAGAAPTSAEISSAVETFRRFGQRMATPATVYARFEFRKTRP